MATNITSEYLQYIKKHTNEYGKNIIVLLKVGAFYEMYGLKNKDDNVVGSDVEKICKICDLQLSERSNMFHDDKPVLIAGFRDYCLDKYVEKITANNYTCFVYDQFEENKKYYRKLVNVFSPGTYFNTNENELQNITMVIWYELINKTKIIFGISHINIITGQTYLCEYIENYSKTPTILDNLERYLSIYNPCEIICVTNLNNDENVSLMGMLHIQTKNVRTIYLNTSDGTNNSNRFSLQANNCTKQVYIKEVMQNIFQEHDYNSFIHDYLEYTYGLQSFTFLCNWISEHNEYLLDKISPPLLETSNDTMQLANHSLTQLNVINHENKHKLSSLSSFLNNCLTPMGKREFRDVLVHPTTNVNKLAKEYNYTEYVLEHDEYIGIIRNGLKNMHDLEKLHRQLFLNKITPRHILQIHDNVKSCLELWNYFKQHDNNICEYFINTSDVKMACQNILDYITKSIDIDSMKHCDAMHEKMFVSGYNENLDNLRDNVEKSESMLEKIITCFQDIFIESEKRDITYIKLHTTDKMPPTIICTQKRSSILKKYLDENENIRFVHNNRTIILDNNFTYPKSTAGNVSVHHEKIQKNCDSYFKKKQELIKHVEITFKVFCNEFKQYRNDLMTIVQFITQIDVLQNKAYIANKYNYCRPKILSGITSCVDVKGLRHALIEHINTDETYVKNDIYLNEERNGILLFGTNAVGKTSFMKALGLSIIMAQSGLFVPCDCFEFVPYKKMFTRILNNDNMFKGLSTFAVEMSELRVILQNADKNSIVLGDELCSGTEYESATSIFVSGIQWLHKKNSSFIFATHLHNITTFDEIKELDNVSMNHISVKYDNANDCLIYDRVLKDGPGNSMYGLEVCKSLHLPMDFLDNAHAIRNKYLTNKDSLLMPKSSYNAKKIRNMCELCKEKQATEIHHLMHQSSANTKGFIGHVHKNNVANLASICEDCHQKIHHESLEMRRVKTTKGYNFSSLK